MPQSSRELDDCSDTRNLFGPDIFDLYVREILDLLNKDDEFPIFGSRTNETLNNTYSTRVLENREGTNSSCHLNSLFSNCLEDAIPDVKRQLLKTALTQSVKDLTLEVNEMIDPVMRINYIRTCIRSKKEQSEGKALLDQKSLPSPCKKQKLSSAIGQNDLFAVQNRDTVEVAQEVDGDLKFLLENEDTLQLEETITKHCDDLDVTLNHMEQKLEELLDAVVSKCRLMTREEKQELGKLIQKLPPKNLDRMVEIINHGKSLDSSASSEIFVDLGVQGNTTLWRLYFYVKAVENAKKLGCSISEAKCNDKR